MRIIGIAAIQTNLPGNRDILIRPLDPYESSIVSPQFPLYPCDASSTSLSTRTPHRCASMERSKMLSLARRKKEKRKKKGGERTGRVKGVEGWEWCRFEKGLCTPKNAIHNLRAHGCIYGCLYTVTGFYSLCACRHLRDVNEPPLLRLAPCIRLAFR